MLGKLGIETNEKGLVKWGARTLLLIGFCDISMQNAAEALFIKRVGVEFIPLAFLASSLVLVFTTSFLGWYVIRHWRPKTLSIILILLSVLIIPLWLLVKFDIFGSVVILTVLFEQIKAVSLLVFWISMGKMLTARQAKRLFAPLLAGVTAGTIIGSFLSAPLSNLVGIEGLLALAAVVLLISAGFAYILESKGLTRLERDLAEDKLPYRNEEEDPKESTLECIRRIWSKSKLFRLLMIATVCSGILMPMLYFEFSYVADLATKGSGGEQKLLALYSQLRGWLFLCVLVVQISFASKIYRFIGVPIAVALSPLIYLLGFFGLTFFMSLPTGIISIASAQLQDKAVYTPGVRILYNLFSEDFKSTAIALLDGPIMRSGCALGSITVFAIVTFANATVVGYFAIPVALAWITVSIVLWKIYPNLLLQVSTENSNLNKKYEAVEELFDPGTIHNLSTKLTDSSEKVRDAAIFLLEDAPAKISIDIFVNALPKAVPKTRHHLMRTLDKVLEPEKSSELKNSNSAQTVYKLLNEKYFEEEEETVLALLFYGRFASKQNNNSDSYPAIKQYLKDSSAAVQLSAAYTLTTLGESTDDISKLLQEAVNSSDNMVRLTALKILRVHLMDSEHGAPSELLLNLLVDLTNIANLKVESVKAIALVASVHQLNVSSVTEKILSMRHDESLMVRLAVIKYVGELRLSNQAPWLVSRLESDEEEEVLATRDSLLSLGEGAANALMIEHRFGKRSYRNEIISIIKELKIKPESLKNLYNDEIKLLQETVINQSVLKEIESNQSSLLTKRMNERIEEGIHAALLLLSAINDDNRITELADHLSVTKNSKQKAILIEALETLLKPEEKKSLIPLVEGSDFDSLARSYSKELGISIPGTKQIVEANLNSPDELTRTITIANMPDEYSGSKRTLVDTDRINGGKINPIQIAQSLSNFSLFSGLPTRQLVDLAKVMHEEIHFKDSTIVEEGEEGMSMYLIVNGEVEIKKGDTSLSTLEIGEVFGEMAVFEKETRSATVVAKTDSRLLRLEGHELTELIYEQPEIAFGIATYLSKRVLDLNTKLEKYDNAGIHGGASSAL